MPRSAAAVLALQRTAGNAAVVRMLARQAGGELWEDWDAGGSGGDGAAGIGAAIHDGALYKLDMRGFLDPAVDAELQRHGQRIGIDTTLTAGEGAPSSPKVTTGDSAGKPVASHPPWVEVFQDHLASPAAQQAIPGKPNTTTWSEDDRVAQRLLRIFLTRWTEIAQGYVPPAVAELYEHVGGFESNEATNEFGVGAKDQKDWCALASSAALTESMLKAGVRFAKPPPPHTLKKRRYGINRQAEINLQAAAYREWVDTVGRKLGGRLGANDARGASILAGDILSFYSSKHGPESTGHVVTVVRALEQPTLQVASGNAAGEAVRMEEVVVADPPAGFGSASDARPAGEKEIWIFSLVRASWLNALVAWVNSGNRIPDDMLVQFGVEHCDPLDALYGGDGRPLPAEPVGGTASAGDVYDEVFAPSGFG